LKEIFNDLQTNQQMDLAAIKLEEIINIAVNSNIPKKKIIEFFKPWWNEIINQKKIKLNQMKKT